LPIILNHKRFEDHKGKQKLLFSISCLQRMALALKLTIITQVLLPPHRVPKGTTFLGYMVTRTNPDHGQLAKRDSRREPTRGAFTLAAQRFIRCNNVKRDALCVRSGGFRATRFGIPTLPCLLQCILLLSFKNAFTHIGCSFDEK